MSLAYAFPGVGVRFCGEERAFYSRHRRLLDPLLEEASERAAQDLTSALSQGSVSGLGELESQLFTFAWNCGVASVFREHGQEASFVAGHSMGLYSALVSAGTLSFSDGLAVTAILNARSNIAVVPGADASIRPVPTPHRTP